VCRAGDRALTVEVLTEAPSFIVRRQGADPLEHPSVVGLDGRVQVGHLALLACVTIYMRRIW